MPNGLSKMFRLVVVSWCSKGADPPYKKLHITHLSQFKPMNLSGWTKSIDFPLSLDKLRANLGFGGLRFNTFFIEIFQLIQKSFRSGS